MRVLGEEKHGEGHTRSDLLQLLRRHVSLLPTCRGAWLADFSCRRAMKVAFQAAVCSD